MNPVRCVIIKETPGERSINHVVDKCSNIPFIIQNLLTPKYKFRKNKLLR